MPNLHGKVCLVTGASRGIGRGIAIQLVTFGATCYITGRKMKDLKLVEEELKSRGAIGLCICIECDHSCDENVKALFKQIASEQNNKLDLLVNNAFAGISYLTEHSPQYFWDQSADESWDKMNKVGLRNNYICAVYASRMMVHQRKGLIVNISSFGSKMYLFLPPYGIGKTGNDRMTLDCAMELAKFNVAFVSIWPGWVRTEFMTKANEDKILAQTVTSEEEALNYFFDRAETPEYCGKCIAHLLDDPNIMKKTGSILLTSDIGDEFGFKDVNGKKPIGQRSFQLLLAFTPLKFVSPYIPTWMKLPKWMYFIALGYQNVKPTNKKPSNYE